MLLAIIVSYYPDKEKARLNLEQYIDYVDAVLIWENTPSAVLLDYRIKSERSKEKIFYMGVGENIGMASALNRAFKWGIEHQFTYVLTMDQDSFFPDSIFSVFKNKALNFFRIDREVAAVTTNPNYKIKDNDEKIIVEDCITSGTIYSIEHYLKIGPFRDEFFIDAVDLEYSYKIRLAGYKIFMLPDCLLQQTYGNYTKTKFSFSTSNYSVARTYYIVRNHIFVWREYPDLFTLKWNFLKVFILYRIVMILLGERQKCKKIYAIVCGIYDGMNGIYNKRKF